jgi:hypothetical protein
VFVFALAPATRVLAAEATGRAQGRARQGREEGRYPDRLRARRNSTHRGRWWRSPRPTSRPTSPACFRPRAPRSRS